MVTPTVSLILSNKKGTLMNEHFIKNIEIKNFKCFEDFKAEGFGRVNLIGGKNNVGKTAFMEACFLGLPKKNTKEYIENTLIIELHRNSLDFLLEWMDDFTLFIFKYEQSLISINHNIVAIKIIERDMPYTEFLTYNDDAQKILDSNPNAQKSVLNKSMSFDEKYQKVTNEIKIDLLSNFYKEKLPPLIFNISFISVGNNFNNYLISFIDEIKLLDREDDLNRLLKIFFEIEKIDIIKNKVMLKKDKKYLLLSEFGDGVKHFLNIILALYLNKDSILYLDELENGIHYSNLDKLWEIILTISKQQNVQVFATTHSKECIESYARVAKKLEDEEIAFIELGRNKQNELDSVVMNSEMFQRFITLGNEVRGW